MESHRAWVCILITQLATLQLLWWFALTGLCSDTESNREIPSPYHVHLYHSLSRIEIGQNHSWHGNHFLFLKCIPPRTGFVGCQCIHYTLIIKRHWRPGQTAWTFIDRNSALNHHTWCTYGTWSLGSWSHGLYTYGNLFEWQVAHTQGGQVHAIATCQSNMV